MVILVGAHVLNVKTADFTNRVSFAVYQTNSVTPIYLGEAEKFHVWHRVGMNVLTESARRCALNLAPMTELQAGHVKRNVNGLVNIRHVLNSALSSATVLFVEKTATKG